MDFAKVCGNCCRIDVTLNGRMKRDASFHISFEYWGGENMKKLVKKASEKKVRMVSLYANEGGTNKNCWGC